MLRNSINFKTVMLTALGVILFSATAPVHADGAGAFLGGVAVAKIGHSVRERNEYEQQQAYYAQQQAQAAQRQADSAQQQSSASLSAEEKIAQLDKLAAGGYISPEEYKSRKQAILDSM